MQAGFTLTLYSIIIQYFIQYETGSLHKEDNISNQA